MTTWEIRGRGVLFRLGDERVYLSVEATRALALGIEPNEAAAFLRFARSAADFAEK